MYTGDYYNVYGGRDGEIDYETAVAMMELDAEEVEIADQDLPANSIWHYVRRQVRDECGLESESSDACIVQIDGDGQARSPAPNTPQALTAEAIAGGKVKLRWRYSPDGQAAAPHGFAVYQTQVRPFGSTPAGIVFGGFAPNMEFTWYSLELAEGTWHFAVVAFNNGGGISPPATVMAVVDATGPAAIQTLLAEEAS